jgi:Ca-activated chloride channel family protein
MRRTALAALLACSALMLAACSGGSSSSDSSVVPGPDPTAVTSYVADPQTLTIVAGSEQRAVVDAVVTPWCSQVRKITCNVTYLGSVDQARLLQSGTAPYDAFWFASSVFAQLGDQKKELQDLASMSVTPIVFAGWKSEMTKLGFVGRDVTIDEVLAAVESGKTKTWVTNPTQSNSGASVYLGYLNYFAGNPAGQALSEKQLAEPAVTKGITRFVRAFQRTPPSTGTLMDDCIAQPDQCRTMFTYEDLVMERDQKLVAAGKEPLYVVYPKGSLAIADAPLGYLPHGDNPAKKANFEALQNYLLTDAGAQEKLLALGRRPADITGLALTNAPKDVFNPAWGIATTIKDRQLTYPAGPVIDAALSSYQLSFRSPADVVYCIDGSGSMAGNHGWEGVTAAADLLFNPDQAKRYFLQVSPGDRTTVIVFSDDTKGGPWTVTGNADSDLSQLENDVTGLSPDGGTALYGCLGHAADFYDANPSGGRKRLVILMTDGQNNVGDSSGLDQIAALNVPVIAVAFGSDADKGAMQDIASQTQGAFISSDNLVTALRNATSYK